MDKSMVSRYTETSGVGRLLVPGSPCICTVKHEGYLFFFFYCDCVLRVLFEIEVGGDSNNIVIFFALISHHPQSAAQKYAETILPPLRPPLESCDGD